MSTRRQLYDRVMARVDFVAEMDGADDAEFTMEERLVIARLMIEEERLDAIRESTELHRESREEARARAALMAPTYLRCSCGDETQVGGGPKELVAFACSCGAKWSWGQDGWRIR